MSKSNVIILKRRGRPPLPPELKLSEEEKRIRRNARWLKWYHNMSPDRKKEYNRDRHVRLKLREYGLGGVIEELDREVEEETGDFIM